MRVAVITGTTGQDGSYLVELLSEKGYKIYGMCRRTSTTNTQRLKSITPNLELKYGDLTDGESIIALISEAKEFMEENKITTPLEIYNLAAQSHVKVSFDMPEYTAKVDAIGPLLILEAIRVLKLEKQARVYQASTSELYGATKECPQNENTPFYPRSPYGVAKLYSFWIIKNYRENYGIHASNGILFNHESPRRGSNFVTRKITKAVNDIHEGKQDCLRLGNMYAKRDWGHAQDYVEAMWLILQQDNPDDYVISTGETHTVKEFVERTFSYYDTELVWEGEGINEKGRCKKTGKLLVEIDPQFFRPSEVDLLLGDSTKAQKVLGWKPRYTFESLVKDMVEGEKKKTELY